MTKGRTGLYARVSTENQAAGGTIHSQVAAIEDRATVDDCRIDPDLRFLDEGYSGSTLIRPALERLRDIAAAGAIDRLYVHSPDRLARNYAYQVVLLDELVSANVSVVFVNRPLRQSPEDYLLLQVQGMMSEFERAKILERSRRGRRYAALQGSVNVLTKAPYGYRYHPKGECGGIAHFEVIPEHAAIVRRIFEAVGQDRLSIEAVRRGLMTDEIPSPKGMARWDHNTLWGILENPAYAGRAAFGKTVRGPMRPRLKSPRGKPDYPRQANSIYDTPQSEWITIPVPGIVTEELFEATAEQLQENRQRARVQRQQPRYLMQGLIVCGLCRYAYLGVMCGGHGRNGTIHRNLDEAASRQG